MARNASRILPFLLSTVPGGRGTTTTTTTTTRPRCTGLFLDAASGGPAAGRRLLVSAILPKRRKVEEEEVDELNDESIYYNRWWYSDEKNEYDCHKTLLSILLTVIGSETDVVQSSIQSRLERHCGRATVMESLADGISRSIPTGLGIYAAVERLVNMR
jgi:hypothetical protein